MHFDELTEREKRHYERMWGSEKEQWFLSIGDTGIKIPINRITRVFCVIEDDGIAEYVTRRMENNGVEVLRDIPWKE